MPHHHDTSRDPRAARRGARVYEEEHGVRQEILWRLGVGAILGAVLLLVVLSSAALRPLDDTSFGAAAPDQGTPVSAVTQIGQEGN